jgi:uncharacterized protein involved in exopolysaccharide biosynthesis
MADQSLNQADPDEFGLAHYLRVMRRQKFAAVTTVWLVCSLTVAYLYLRPAQYTSVAQLFFEPALEESIFNPGPALEDNRATDRIPNEIVLLKSQSVRDAVKKSLGWPESRPSSLLADHVVIRRLPDSSIVTLTATAETAEEAHQIALKYAETYMQIRRDQRLTGLKTASDQVSAELDEVRKQLAEVEAPIVEIDARVIATLDTATRDRLIDQRDELVRRTEPQRASLQARYAELDNKLKDLGISAKLTTNAGIQMVSTPQLPAAPSGLDLKKALAAALGLGLLLAIVVAFLREALQQATEAEPAGETEPGYHPRRSARRRPGLMRKLDYRRNKLRRRPDGPKIEFVPEPDD